VQEARAKLELREVITTEMALDVVNLMRESMLDTLTDEFGGIDFSRTAGTSKKGVDVGVGVGISGCDCASLGLWVRVRVRMCTRNNRFSEIKDGGIRLFIVHPYVFASNAHVLESQVIATNSGRRYTDRHRPKERTSSLWTSSS
jgi:hypothetical protein